MAMALIVMGDSAQVVDGLRITVASRVVEEGVAARKTEQAGVDAQRGEMLLLRRLLQVGVWLFHVRIVLFTMPPIKK